MRISLEGLQIIDAIHRRGSFAGAAQELCRVPSTITYGVQKLEGDLGLTLFHRNGHRPRLTPAGEDLLKEGRLILQAAADLEARLKDASRADAASVRIVLDGALPCGPMLELVREFYAEPQYACTDLRIAHEAVPNAWDAPLAQHADLVVGASGDALPGDSRHRRQSIGSLDVVAVAGGRHPLAAQRGPIPHHILRTHKLALLAGSSTGQPLRATRPARQSCIALPDMPTLRAALAMGLAIALVPRALVARELGAGAVIEIKLEPPPRRSELYVAWEDGPKGEAFEWWLARLARPALVERMALGKRTRSSGIRASVVPERDPRPDVERCLMPPEAVQIADGVAHGIDKSALARGRKENVGVERSDAGLLEHQFIDVHDIELHVGARCRDALQPIGDRLAAGAARRAAHDDSYPDHCLRW